MTGKNGECCGNPGTEASAAEGTQAVENCCCRTKHRTERERRELINRLNRVEGQIRGIRAMVEDERYCVDILTQVTAAKSALDGFSRILLNQHIQTCVVERIQDGDQEVVDELCAVIHRLMK